MRRALSIVLYVLGGLFLTSQMMLAFFDLEAREEGSIAAKSLVLGLFLALSLIPLALGMWISPGQRLKELGIVLFSAAMVAAIELSISTFIAIMPDTAVIFSSITWPQIDISGGILNLLLLGGFGYWLMKKFPSPP